MSAWIVSRAHIDVLVQGLCESEHVTHLDPDEVGRILWRENLASVAERYPNDGDGERPGPIDFRDADVDTYTYRRPSMKITQAGLHKAIGCYQYQSSEHLGWEASQARSWTSTLAVALEQAGVPALSDSEPWGFEEEHVHGTAVQS